MRWTRSVSSDPAASGSPDIGGLGAVTPSQSPGPSRGGSGSRPVGFWEGVQRVLPATRVAMEYCWLYPWIVVIGGGLYGRTSPLLSAGWTFLLMLAGQASVKPLLDRGGSLRRSRVILVSVGVVLGLLAIHEQYYSGVPLWQPAWFMALLRATHDVLPALPRPVAGALVASLLWWRGLALGAREVGAIEIEQAYKTGVGMIVVYFIAAAIYPDSSGFQAAGPTLPGTLPAFFFLGLSALALARLGTIWDASRPDERAHFPARAWLLLIVGVVGMILLMASMTAGLAAADVSTYLGLALRPLLPVLEIFFVAVFFVAGLLVRVIIAVLSRIPRRDIPETSPAPTVIDDLLRRLREINLNPQVVEGARWTMVLAVLLLLAIGMALTIVWMRRRERHPDEDEHESIWSAREMLRGLANLLPRLRLRRSGPQEPAAQTVRAIRLIYRELLRLGAGLGAVRQSWATPREHDPRLRTVLPGAPDEVAALTTAYERVRYGIWEPTSAEVRIAQEALDRAKATIPPELKQR